MSLRESLDKRSRGGSKTFDTMMIALYLASIGFIGIWFSPGKEQTRQPQKYMKFIIERSYLKYLIEDLLTTSVTFRTGGSLRVVNLTELNARSPRADFVIYDEEAQAEVDAYRAAVSILSVTKLGLVFHISTPTKASIFEENYELLRRREAIYNHQFIFSRTWEDVSYLASKKEWYEEQKRILPDWYFRQEHMAEFTNAEGSVFKNVIYDPYPDWLMEAIQYEKDCSGIDWNPAAGHCLGSVRWHPTMPIVVVTNEINLGNGYTHELQDEMFNKIRPWFSHGNKLVIEDGGINIAYVKWFQDQLNRTQHNWVNQQWYREEWDSQDVAKMAACTRIYEYGITIYVDKLRYPETAKCIEECHWDEDAKGDPKIAKDPANSPHFLDAFLHAISKKNRDIMTAEVTNFY